MSMPRLTARLFGSTSTLQGQKSDQTWELISRFKGGLKTKIHASCDALENPTGFHLTPGQAHDLDGSDALLPELLEKIQALSAERARDAQERVDSLEQSWVEVVILPKSNGKEVRKVEREKYRWRHLIENFFAKPKQYRGIFTNYDKRACAFMVGIHLVAAMIWLNWLQALVSVIEIITPIGIILFGM